MIAPGLTSIVRKIHSASPRFWGLLALSLLALPILAAIWGLSWFVVQDGPLHLYNAHVLAESLKPSSAFHQFYAVRWLPLPYWGAYVLSAALMSVLPERAADQIIITLCSVGFVACLAWLRRQISGWEGMAMAAPLVVLLGLNVLWLLGLYGFLLGACLYLVTLGVWWKNRGRLGLKQALVLAALLVAGYFCHVVSMAFTVIGLGILAVMTPGDGWRRRVGWTAFSVSPLVPLVLVYRSLVLKAGAVVAQWEQLTSAVSFREWLHYVRVPDLLLLHDPQAMIAGGGIRATLFHAPVPSNWAGAGLILFLLAPLISRQARDRAFIRTHRGWIILTVALLACGFFGPSKFGEAHGGLIRERLLLAGFATLVPILRINSKQVLAWAGTVLLFIATALQVGLLWDYALMSSRDVAAFMEAKPYVGTGKRVAALMVNPNGRFKASPMPHIGNMLGIHTSNMVWNNYAPALYYFPLRFQSDEAREIADQIGDDVQYYDFLNPEKAGEALEDWESLLDESESQIDVLIVWHSTPEVDEINSRWFEDDPVFENEQVKVLIHSPEENPP